MSGKVDKQTAMSSLPCNCYNVQLSMNIMWAVNTYYIHKALFLNINRRS